MCTLTIWQRPGGLHLSMNRDELRGRPHLRLLHDELDERGVSRAWPVDAGAGGTWVGVSSQGLVLALLNHYPSDLAPLRPAPSRGRLVPELLACGDASAAAQALEGLDLSTTNPFRLVGADASGLAWVATWDRRQLLLEPAALPFFATSSSLRTEEIVAWRTGQFSALRRGSPDLGQVRAFHFQDEPADPARGVSMHRPDAATRSYTEVAVRPATVELLLLDRPPRGSWPEAEDPDLLTWRADRV